VQKLPREPTMVTTERPIPSVNGAPPPTMACAGTVNSNERPAMVRGRIFIGAAIARATGIAKPPNALVPAAIPC